LGCGLCRRISDLLELKQPPQPQHKLWPMNKKKQQQRQQNQVATLSNSLLTSETKTDSTPIQAGIE
jgi:hypothetical protein